MFVQIKKEFQTILTRWTMTCIGNRLRMCTLTDVTDCDAEVRKITRRTRRQTEPRQDWKANHTTSHHPLSNLPTTPSASPRACTRSLVSACDALPSEIWGSIPSEGGPDVLLVAVLVGVVVCVSAVNVRKGDGATRGRWNRLRNSLACWCACSFV